MFLPPLHLPLISAGYFGAVVGRILEFMSLRVRRSDQGMTPSLSPGLRAQTVALHRRLAVLAGEFSRLAGLARDGRLRVYPDRASPAARAEPGGVASHASPYPSFASASPFGPPPSVFHGATLPALATHGFGWMLGFVPAAHRDALAGVVRNPEMAALIGASPSVARLLRSLCHGLGVARPEGVFPRPRRRARRDAGVASNGGTELDSASRPREPAVVMSAQARHRWWADRRRADVLAGDEAGAAGRDAPARDRCAKR